jgi:hypothetical protein
MLSNPLAEVRAMGEEIKSTAKEEVPTLVKYADADPSFQEIEDCFRGGQTKEEPLPGDNQDWCRLIRYDPNAEEMILAAFLYKYSGISHSQAVEKVRTLTPSEKMIILDNILITHNRHQSLPRELEYTRYTFDLILDQGAYFELKRHRIMTQTVQPLGISLGYTLPRWISLAGMEKEYRSAMEAAEGTYRAILNEIPCAATYIVPNAYRRRLLIDFNLRSGMHMLSLRSASNAHFSMRRAARRMVDEIQEVQPLLGKFYRVDSSETWQSIENAFFTEA